MTLWTYEFIICGIYIYVCDVNIMSYEHVYIMSLACKFNRIWYVDTDLSYVQVNDYDTRCMVQMIILLLLVLTDYVWTCRRLYNILL